MAELVDVISLIAEVLTWIGFSLGAILMLVGLVPLALSRRWVEVEGVIVTGQSGTETYRWIGSDGEVQEGSADASRAVREPGDDITVYYDAWRPERGRLDSPANDGKAMRFVGGILLVIGGVSTIASVALMFVPAG